MAKFAQIWSHRSWTKCLFFFQISLPVGTCSAFRDPCLLTSLSPSTSTRWLSALSFTPITCSGPWPVGSSKSWRAFLNRIDSMSQDSTCCPLPKCANLVRLWTIRSTGQWAAFSPRSLTPQGKRTGDVRRFPSGQGLAFPAFLEARRLLKTQTFDFGTRLDKRHRRRTSRRRRGKVSSILWRKNRCINFQIAKNQLFAALK